MIFPFVIICRGRPRSEPRPACRGRDTAVAEERRKKSALEGRVRPPSRESVDVRVGAVEVAGDLASHGRMDVESIQFIWVRPTYVVGFAVGPWEPAQWSAEEGHLILLANFPV